MASRVGTAAAGIFRAHASPLAVLRPMRRPVNDPGPMVTASPSSSAAVHPASVRRRSIAGINRSECVTRTSRRYSPITRSPSRSATPPASVEVSRANNRTVASLACAPKDGLAPCDNDREEGRMTPVPRKDPTAVEAEVREKIHLEILKRTGAYHANDHVLLPSGQHTSE